METLADFLRLDVSTPAAIRPREEPDLLDVTDPVEFCRKVVASREFREYIWVGIRLRDLPPALLTRIVDHAWGKPADRIEHTGKDGAPIIEVRRVIVHADARSGPESEERVPVPYTKH